MNQVLYHLGSRDIEYDLIPFLKSQGIAVMAYCPMAHDSKTRNEITNHKVMKAMAKGLEISSEQLMIAFLLAQDKVCPIPKSSTLEHINDNAESLKVSLSQEDLALLNTHFPTPTKKVPLDIL